MYLNLFNDFTLSDEEIIGIFDLDTSTESFTTRKFLREAEQNKKLLVSVRDIPKSFIVTDDNIYLSQMSCQNIYQKLTDHSDFPHFEENTVCV